MPRTLLLLAAALLAAALPLAEPEPCRGARPSAAEKKIEEALAMPTQLEFIETPLTDVVDYLKDYHKIEIQFDKKALDDVGLDPSTTAVSKNLKDISLRSALNLMLRDLELSYLIQDEVLLITTAKHAASRLTIKVYRVGDLIASARQPAGAPAPGAPVGGFPAGGFAGGGSPAGGFPADGHTLIHVITSTVAPDSWTGAPAAWTGGAGGMGMGGMGGMGMGGMTMGGMGGGAPAPPAQGKTAPKGSIAGAAFGRVPVLVVSQSYHVHQEIAALLDELRRVACIKGPTPPKADKRPPAKKPGVPTPAAEPRERPAAEPARDPFGVRDPFGDDSAAGPAGDDPFGEAPAREPPRKGSSSPSDDPFGR